MDPREAIETKQEARGKARSQMGKDNIPLMAPSNTRSAMRPALPGLFGSHLLSCR
jgi:hypothetical protein